ncbi:hypothetical protein [Halorussus salinus]|uniref:hypothetical protein n=1 Tax=Halorussus salinus TaxID=1364935 RepID=UPI00109226B0|nr:hypothetical protein [Halorussus salinus]
MTTSLKIAVTVLTALAVFGLGATVTAGAHVTDFAADPVSAVGHVCDQWGLQNDWGDHRHGDDWTNHPHHGDGHHGQSGDHGPHGGPHGSQGSHGPHR